MITKIKFSNVAIFNGNDDAIVPKKLVFYDVNRSGKTTISSYIDKPTEVDFLTCSIEKTSADIEAIVYNKLFSRSVFYSLN